MSKITDAIEQAAEYSRSKGPECKTCTALRSLAPEDQVALQVAYDEGNLSTTQIADILIEHAGFLGSRSTPRRHFKDRHTL